DYARFYVMVDRVQDLDPAQAREVLALVLRMGRQNWPNRYRRGQRNQASSTAPLAPTTSETTDTVASFILNRSSREDVVHRDGTDYYGFHENVTSAQALVGAGGGQFVYYNTSSNSEHRMYFVGYGQLEGVEEVSPDAEGRRSWRARVTGYTEFDQPVPKAEGAPPHWNSQHSIAKISGDSFDRIVELGTGRRQDPEPLTVDRVAQVCLEQGLLLPRRTVTALVAALTSGKHVILTGPPGTAKTTLAVLVAQVAAAQNLCAGHLLTTATADWSTYDTIGGLAPTTDNQLAYRPGRFVEAIESDLWLVVDEMNRSNFDRAFGQLFTVLAGADVTLPYNDADTDLPIRITSSTGSPDSRYRDIVVSRDWRMIATINNFDKSLLFEMSFALMRRFAFVEVPAPDPATYRRLVAEHTESPDPAVTAAATTAVEALLPLRSLKELGPAIFIDAAKLALQLVLAGSSPSDTTFTVFYALMLPQFEGLDESRGAQLLRLVTTAVADRGRRNDVVRVLREVLGLELPRATSTADELGTDDEDGIDDLGTSDDLDMSPGAPEPGQEPPGDEEDGPLTLPGT
ncbi:MAG: AAA family ATPase, partial [Janthinobacterium lividum]